MKKLSVAAFVVSAALSNALFAATPAITDTKFIDESSYALGVVMGKQIEEMVSSQKDLVALDTARILAGVEDTVQGKLKLSDEEVGKQLQALTEKLAEVEKAKADEAAKQAKAQVDAFRAEFAKKEGVKETKSGILYRIDKAGEGVSPKPEDTVKVHYTGKLPDGTVFDSSRERGQPVEFKLDQLIPGWVEGIQLLKKGGKIELVLPPELAYGENGAGDIPPNSTLYFDIDLLDVTPAKK